MYDYTALCYAWRRLSSSTTFNLTGLGRPRSVCAAAAAPLRWMARAQDRWHFFTCDRFKGWDRLQGRGSKNLCASGKWIFTHYSSTFFFVPFSLVTTLRNTKVLVGDNWLWEILWDFVNNISLFLFFFNSNEIFSYVPWDPMFFSFLWC